MTCWEARKSRRRSTKTKLFWRKEKLHSRTSAGRSPNLGDRPPKTTKIEVQQSGRRSFAQIQANDRPGNESQKNSLGRTFTNFGRTFTKLGGRSPNLGERSPGQFLASTFYEPNVCQTPPNDRQTSLIQKRWRFNFVSRGEIRSNNLAYKYIMFWTEEFQP